MLALALVSLPSVVLSSALPVNLSRLLFPVVKLDS